MNTTDDNLKSAYDRFSSESGEQSALDFREAIGNASEEEKANLRKLFGEDLNEKPAEEKFETANIEEKKSPEFSDLQSNISEYEKLAPEARKLKKELDELENSSHDILNSNGKYAPKPKPILDRQNFKIVSAKEDLQKNEDRLLELLSKMRKDVAEILENAPDDAALDEIFKNLKKDISDSHLRNHLLNEHTKERVRRLLKKGEKFKSGGELEEIAGNSKALSKPLDDSKKIKAGIKAEEKAEKVEEAEEKAEDKKLIGEITEIDDVPIVSASEENLIGGHEDGRGDGRDGVQIDGAAPSIQTDGAKIDQPDTDSFLVSDNSPKTTGDEMVQLDDLGSEEKILRDKDDGAPDFTRIRENREQDTGKLAQDGIKVVEQKPLAVDYGFSDGTKVDIEKDSTNIEEDLSKKMPDINIKPEIPSTSIKSNIQPDAENKQSFAKAEDDKPEISNQNIIVEKLAEENVSAGIARIQEIRDALHSDKINQEILKPETSKPETPEAVETKNVQSEVVADQKASPEITVAAEASAENEAPAEIKTETEKKPSGLAGIWKRFVGKKGELDSNAFRRGEEEIRKIREENIEQDKNAG